MVDVVRRASNTFLQAEARNAQATASKNIAFSDRLDRLQKAVFASDSDIGTYIQGFFEKVQDLASNPTSLPVRITVLGAAGQLSDRFQALSRTLNKESESLLSDATDQLAEANALTQQIAQVNKNLNSGGSGAQKSNDLLDQRDTLIDRLVKIVGVTVEENATGSVNIYVGQGTGGAELITADGAKSLAVNRSGSKINLIVDPYGRATTVGEMSGGSLAGVLAYNDQVVTSVDQINRLATGISTAFNRQHMAGIDLNGDTGKKMFSTDSLAPVPSPTNRGRTSASLDVTSASQIQNSTYSARYDAVKANWVVTAKSSGETATGATSVAIDGITFKFSGEPADGDTFTFQPLADAALGFHLLLEDPTQIAAGLPQLAQGGLYSSASEFRPSSKAAAPRLFK
jgi:flagellar hook-associated protein 1 FlgK